MRVGIVAKPNDDRAASVAAAVRADLRASGVDVVVDDATAAALDSSDDLAVVSVDEMADCDLVASIGGDGTFLHAARGAGATPVLGVNLGEVGFLNAVAPGDAVETVRAEVESRREGAGRTRTLPRLAVRGDAWTVTPAINEIAVLGPQRGHGRGVDVTVRVDGEEFADGHADGVLVATATGSTAYSLSEGGPLVHPAVDGFVVTEMAGTAGTPPLVVGSDSDVTVELTGAAEAVVASDGRVGERVTPPAAVTVGRAAEPLRIAGPPPAFFEGLAKLD